MVVVTLKGGLGNQLFQYSTGRAIALRTGTELQLDLSEIGNYRGPNVTDRPLHLNIFDFPANYVDYTEKNNLQRAIYEKLGSMLWLVSKDAAVKIAGVYKDDQTYKYDQRVNELPGDMHLKGYWQSEEYFKSYDEKIREEVSIPDPPVGKNREWYEQICDTESLSVHVRRGDYVNLDRALPPEYYRKAFRKMVEIAAISDVFVFSDDMKWVREHRQELIPHDAEFDLNYVECNDGSTAHEDLRLMRACDHHIVANSTCSWWGAWLDESDSKRIIAPNYWIRGRTDNLDIVPDRWQKVGW
jgi:hypothetical protein